MNKRTAAVMCCLIFITRYVNFVTYNKSVADLQGILPDFEKKN